MHLPLVTQEGHRETWQLITVMVKKLKVIKILRQRRKSITQNASPASSARRSSTSSRKQTKQTLVKDNLTNMRKSARLENKNLSDTPQSKEKSKKTQEEIKKKNSYDGKAKDSEETVSEAITSSSSDILLNTGTTKLSLCESNGEAPLIARIVKHINF
ncbi:hypothetical protein Tco_0573331 [Tanacetum coccineum]